MTKDEVLTLCNAAGVKYGIDPLLLCAIAEQESGYASDATRMENGFLRKYVHPLPYVTLVKIWLATSYGLMQTMGESLREMGYFATMDLDCVGHMLTSYLASPEDQINQGTLWFMRKLKIAGGDVQKALCYWNGDMTGKYANEVLARRDRLKTEMTK